MEEEAGQCYWWILYHWLEDGWLDMGAFVSACNLMVQTAPLFAEVSNVAITVDPHHAVLLVVEDGPYYRWWVVHWTSAVSGSPIVSFVAPKRAFVVPI